MTLDVFERGIAALYRPPSDFSYLNVSAYQKALTQTQSPAKPQSVYEHRYIFGEQPRSAAAAVKVMYNALFNAGIPYYGDLSRAEAEEILSTPGGYAPIFVFYCSSTLRAYRVVADTLPSSSKSTRL